MKIIDVSRAVGGMQAMSIFRPWEEAERLMPADFSEVEKLIPECDIIVFGGGADIHPSLYKHQNVATHSGRTPSQRDLLEELAFKMAVKHKKAILGVCRGAQLTCALSGGWLYQHVPGHGGGYHPITTDDGQTLDMTTYHHQQMNPSKVKHKLIAWTDAKSDKKQYDYHKIKAKQHEVLVNKKPVDSEIVYFPTTNALAVQGHPEFMDVDHPTVEYVRNLCKQYLFKG